MSQISIVMGEKYYTKDPQSSELGQRIVQESIQLLYEIGYEQFTFKKLAASIQSTEASIYRYFDNKHRLLIYLTNWYWEWVDYMIDYDTHHLTDPQSKLERTWEIVCHVKVNTETQLALDVATLRHIVVRESDKTYLTKEVDEINKDGLFKGFKRVCHRIAEMILQISPSYNYPHALASTMLEASNQQAFFSLHLPSLTEIRKNTSSTINKDVSVFINQSVNLILKAHG